MEDVIASEGEPTLPAILVSQADRLSRLAFLLVGTTHDAEDVVATVYARVARRGLDSIADPGAYLARAVVNEARSHHRRPF